MAFAFPSFSSVLLSCLIVRTVSVCILKPYLNKCNVRDSTEDDDSLRIICNCDEVLYCTVIDIPSRCNSTLITLKGLPFNASHNRLHCSLASVGSEINSSEVNISALSKDEIQVDISKIASGKYKATCSQHNNSQCTIAKVSPGQINVDEDVELELSLEKSSDCNSSQIWCFVKTPDRDFEILEAIWITKDKIKCSFLTLAVIGKYEIWVDELNKKRANRQAGSKNTFEVYGKGPVAEQAEYSPDLQALHVYFDQNIEIPSNCENIFSKESQDHFGKDFACSTKGNVLLVKMGVEFTVMSHLEIVAGNGIHRARVELPSFAPPVSLQVSEKRVLSPTLSLSLSNPSCDIESNEKYINIEAVALKSQNLDDYHKASTGKSPGKSHRENLIIWRIIRQLQHKLSYRIASFHSDATHLLHSFENLEKLETFMDGEENTSGQSPSSSDVVSVVIKSPPAPSMIVAEVNVTFCRGAEMLFKYRWLVNEENIEEEGKLLVVQDLPPGKYVIACLVVAYNSTEILGQGWTTTEIVDHPDNTIIYPKELVVGERNDILLYSSSWRKETVHWSCKDGGNQSCYTADRKLLSEVVNLDSSNIRIPGGTLKPGRYTWTINNSEEQNTAKVFIRPGNTPIIRTDNFSPIVNSTQKVMLGVTVSQVQPGCLIWWSSVRQKGYDYIDLNSVGGVKTITTKNRQPQNITLTIPNSNEKWEGLKPDSRYIFKLQVVCPDSSSHVKIPILVNDPPVVSQLVVEPEEGKALITDFTIHHTEANDQIEDYPLIFEWSYVDPCGVETEIRRGAFPRAFTTYLPPGDLTVVLKVCDVKQSCSIASSSVVTVYQFGDIPRENFEKVFLKIQYLLAGGDSSEAFGLAVTLFKTLSLTFNTEIRDKAYTILTQEIRAKIKDLTGALERDPKITKKSLEFLEQATSVVKYFRKGSEIFQDLLDFKNTILAKSTSSRSKRSTTSMSFDSIFKFHSLVLGKNDTIQNRMEFLKDVQRYMLKVCAEALTSFSADSPVVNITMLKVEGVKEKSASFKFHDGFILNVSGEILKQKLCLVVARFDRDLLGNTKESRVTKVYEVKAVRNGKFVKPNKSNSTAVTMTARVRHPPQSGLDCMTWTKTRGWSLKCSLRGVTSSGVTCHCKEFGYFAVFLRHPSTKINATIRIEKWDASVSFKIDKDYDSIVEGNVESYCEEMKKQIANQMTIPLRTISGLYITPGSVIVTIFFIDLRDFKAESIVKELVTRLHNGDLHFKHPFSVDVRKVEVMVPKYKSSDSWKVRNGVYATLAATISTIVATAICSAYIKRTRIVRLVSKPSQEHPPMYRQFWDELSLTGSPLRRTSTSSRN